MVVFEISVNGERRFVGDDVTAITLAADWIARRKADRVSLHVGVGQPGDRQVQYLGADLGPGDDVSIRILSDDENDDAGRPLESCSFCGKGAFEIQSLVAGPQVAICDSCLDSLDAVVARSAPLPLGASIREQGDLRCGFCGRGTPEVAGLLVRNAAALCPECLRACVDMTRGTRE